MSEPNPMELAKTLAPDGRTYGEIAARCRWTVGQVSDYYQKMKKQTGDTSLPIPPPDDPMFKGRTTMIIPPGKIKTGN
ncbi:MAG: hypothetical protein PHV34_14465 [Verrucomicrobiae bacterium]|nr:hypothetical protein [Verrucomicrobiae bacterium]